MIFNKLHFCKRNENIVYIDKISIFTDKKIAHKLHTLGIK